MKLFFFLLINCVDKTVTLSTYIKKKKIVTPFPFCRVIVVDFVDQAQWFACPLIALHHRQLELLHHGSSHRNNLRSRSMVGCSRGRSRRNTVGGRSRRNTVGGRSRNVGAPIVPHCLPQLEQRPAPRKLPPRLPPAKSCTENKQWNVTSKKLGN